jgi:hypothetical protein
MLCFTGNPIRKLVFAAPFFMLSASVCFADIAVNGSFEDVQISAPFSSNPADIPGWTHTGDQGDALLWRAGPQCCGGTNTALAGDGNQFVTMGGGFGSSGSAAWSQTLNDLTIGQTYVVDFKMAAEGETPTQQLTVAMTSGSLTPSETFTSPVTDTLFWQNWGSDQYTFVPTATSSTLQFSAANQQFDVGLDAVSVTPQTSVTLEPGVTFVVLILLALLIGVKLKSQSRPEGVRPQEN